MGCEQSSSGAIRKNGRTKTGPLSPEQSGEIHLSSIPSPDDEDSDSAVLHSNPLTPSSSTSSMTRKRLRRRRPEEISVGPQKEKKHAVLSFYCHRGSIRSDEDQSKQHFNAPPQLTIEETTPPEEAHLVATESPETGSQAHDQSGSGRHPHAIVRAHSGSFGSLPLTISSQSRSGSLQYPLSPHNATAASLWLSIDSTVGPSVAGSAGSAGESLYSNEEVAQYYATLNQQPYGPRSPVKSQPATLAASAERDLGTGPLEPPTDSSNTAAKMLAMGGVPTAPVVMPLSISHESMLSGGSSFHGRDTPLGGSFSPPEASFHALPAYPSFPQDGGGLAVLGGSWSGHSNTNG